MLMVKPFAAALVLATVALTASAEAQGRRNWELTASNGKLGRIAVPSPLGERKAYWYFAFTLENKTGAERPLALFVRGSSDEESPFHEGFYPAAAELVEARLGGDRLTLGERPRTIADGQKLEMLAILGPVDPEADLVMVDVAGLAEPVIREKGKEYHDPRALRFHFKRAGDEFYTSFDLLETGSTEWVRLSDRRQLPNAARAKRD
jgi:hypothetical protein